MTRPEHASFFRTFLRATVLGVALGAAKGLFAAETNSLKDISIEELLEIKVTSAGRKAEPWFVAPTAIEILTEEDIRRYGSVSLPDTLRLVPGLHVARYKGNSYAITARGFNGTAANKMLVMMDGRTLYTPLFSGVYWEVQDTLLLDLDRIEVIRGPGATLWGANAVNGVINITSREARETLGTLIQAGGGNEDIGFGAVRYGAQAGESTYWRVYSKYRYRDEQILSSGLDAEDFSSHWQSGFRTDTYLSDVHQLTFQGDLFWSDFGQYGRDDANHDGGNISARWTRQFSENSDLQLQVYYDRFDRDEPSLYREERNTIDADLQHRFQLGERHDIVWGFNYRVTADDTRGESYSFDPSERSLNLFSGFAQDEISLVPEKLRLTLGTKLEYNEFTGFEWQPGVRLAWIPTDNQVIWGAITKAVRTPTRLESDSRYRPVAGTDLVGISGNSDFRSEDLIAYELGYRIRPFAPVSIDITGFYNDYDNLRTLEPTGPTLFSLTYMNERRGETYGVEASIKYQATDWWRVMASYTFLEEDLEFKPGSRDPTGGNAEANDPEQMARIRSTITLPFHIEFDQVLRYVDQLPNPHVPSYVELDLRLAWRPKPGLEISINGMNLLDSAHPEFVEPNLLQTEVQRSVYGKITWLF